jgi:concanavalin A-like lectin/glucanase superfamily protein
MKALDSLSAGLLIAFCASTAALADIIDSSLVLRFNFDSAPVADVIADTSPGAGHPGTNLNAIWLAGESGRSGVTQFKAPLPDQITVRTNAVLNSATGTISFWIKSSGTSGGGDFGAILFDRRTTRGDVIVMRDDGTIFVQAREGGQNVNSFSTAGLVNDGQWHHIAYVYDQSASGSISIFIDGAPDVSQANSQAWGWPANQQIELGSSHDPFWRVFDGVMDDFMVHNRILSQTEIAATFAGNPVADNSLVLRLNFAAAPVNDVVVDSSSSGANPGNNRGATWVTAEGGRNGLMRFELPIFTQITAAAHPDFDVLAGTIAFWMKSTGNIGPGDFGSILFDRRTGGNGDVIVMRDDGTVFVQAQGSGQGVNSFSTQSKVNDGQWHHVAYVYGQSDVGVIRVYIDGALSGSKTNSAPWSWPTDQQIELGRSHDSFWYAFDGVLDEVRFYNRPLTPAEVTEIGVQPTLKFDVQPAEPDRFRRG